MITKRSRDDGTVFGWKTSQAVSIRGASSLYGALPERQHEGFQSVVDTVVSEAGESPVSPRLLAHSAIWR